MQNKKLVKVLLKRWWTLVIASGFVLSMASVFYSGQAHAGQMTSRLIEMSDSGPSGGSITSGVGSGASVAYKVTFTPSASASVGGIVIDFCSNSALVGDTCTAPTGFNVNRSTTTVAAQTAGCGTGTLGVYTSDTTNNRIIITRATAAATSGACSVDLGNGTSNGLTNPSTTGTFTPVYIPTLLRQPPRPTTVLLRAAM